MYGAAYVLMHQLLSSIPSIDNPNKSVAQDTLEFWGEAPWDAKAGRDGTTFTLRLIGPMSHAEFDWWGKAPNEWESVGTVFDYVMSLAKRHSYGPALCG